ncbi:MAG: hypothetical protein IJJ72_06585 [Bacteroidales bacterium]|nr:hypothetical protein [Bacteroidales bacterium]
MSKLYIFGIGGTGSRVLKSLTMLLASGVDINASEIIPIIIDPDYSAGDLTRTVDMMRLYDRIRKTFKFTSNNRNEFFKTKINLNVLPSVSMPIQNTRDIKFRDFIGLSTMESNGKEDSNFALASMLFSQQNLDSKMQVGFKGNPNIGSVVLNQIQDSPDFQNIISTFQQGDRIFIISSIFGGTGASGFPLLVKNMRALSGNIGGNGFAKNSAIGAVTVLPYFGLKPSDNSEIDSSTFIAKTKAALTYYDRNMNEANVLYYLADNTIKQYDNVEGGKEQKNNAHFIELAAALAIIDFMSIPDNQVQTNDGRPLGTTYKEYGVINDKPSLIFDDLSNQTRDIIRRPLTKFAFFAKFIQEQVKKSKSQPWAVDLHFDDNFFHSDFYGDLEKYVDYLMEWYKEMEDNSRGFAPFQLNVDSKHLFHMVKKLDPAKLPTFNSNYALFDSVLNKEAKSLTMDNNPGERFVELFFRATDTLTEKKLRMK